MDDFRKQFREQWQKLCDEHAAALDMVFEKEGVVSQNPLPIREEIEALEAADLRLQEIERRMREGISVWLNYLRNTG